MITSDNCVLLQSGVSLCRGVLIITQRHHVFAPVGITKVISTTIEYIVVFRIHFDNHISIRTFGTLKDIVLMDLCIV